MEMTKKVLIYLSYNYKTRIHAIINNHILTQNMLKYTSIEDKDFISIDVLEVELN